MNYSKGISWIDDCRIPFVDEEDISSATPGSLNCKGNDIFVGIKNDRAFLNTQGRFPANLLCSDDILNDGTIGKGQKNPRIQKGDKRYGENNFTNGGLYCPDGNITPTYNDQGTNSRYYDIDKWFDYLLDKLQKDTDGTIY